MDAPTEQWLNQALLIHERLAPMVAGLLESLLAAAEIDLLTIAYRTKKRASAAEKIERKGYRDPSTQMTDLSGIRVVVYFESDVAKVSQVISEAFRVDADNSRDRDSLMSVNEIGYRSAHFVCDIGDIRAELPEFRGMSGLKFEVQVRTVLQHAWAELAHDRNYKLGGKLPRGMERQLYLYAGMLEIADRGFDELSQQIDAYRGQLVTGTTAEVLAAKIDSISLTTFVDKWCDENGFSLEPAHAKDVPELVKELAAVGVTTISQLNDLIPEDYAARAARLAHSTNIYGLVRDWILINDWPRFRKSIRVNWTVDSDDEGIDVLVDYLGDDEFNEMCRAFGGDGGR